MAHRTVVSEQTLAALQAIDSCTVSNAIEQFGVRTRNEGFVDSSIKCAFPQIGPRVGYAVTATIRTSSTPVAGRCYYDRGDWWNYVNSCPAPRFLVARDLDHRPGVGALFGEVHAAIARALHCVAFLTNGALRDLPGIERRGIQCFCANVSVTHAYAHIVDFGQPVEIGHLQIHPGDLLHGDLHGVLCVPTLIADEVPAEAERLLAAEGRFLDFCASAGFSFEQLAPQIEKLRLTSDKTVHAAE